MADYADAKHRPHAIHRHEDPTTQFDRGPLALRVTLDAWGPIDNLFTTMYDQLQSNWGESPSRTGAARCAWKPDEWVPDTAMSDRTGWSRLSPEQRAYVLACFQGKTLGQPLELMSFAFTIDGVCRAATHQLVRTRIGAGFMQHGGRDNDWRHRNFTIPETVARAIDEFDDVPRPADLVSCVTDKQMLADMVKYFADVAGCEDLPRLGSVLTQHIEQGKLIYAALVDAGIPWQDARRWLTIGTQTYLHGNYSYLAMRGVLANRLEFVMDWEINCVAQLMVRAIRMACPPLLWRHLGSHSDAAGRAKFAGLESWPPDGKWPTTPEQDALPRMHTKEQMPFWVLSPAAMAGGPIDWIPTNGTYPHEVIAAFDKAVE